MTVCNDSIGKNIIHQLLGIGKVRICNNVGKNSHCDAVAAGVKIISGIFAFPRGNVILLCRGCGKTPRPLPFAKNRVK